MTFGDRIGTATPGNHKTAARNFGTMITIHLTRRHLKLSDLLKVSE